MSGGDVHGLGNISLQVEQLLWEIADWLVAQGAKHIALLARREAPAEVVVLRATGAADARIRAAAVFGVFMIPMLYVVFQWLREWAGGKPAAPPAADAGEVSAPAAAGDGPGRAAVP